jgi:hypothetical protein
MEKTEAEVKGYIEAMIRYHHACEKACFPNTYNKKAYDKIRKKDPAILKELVECVVWNQESFHHGHVSALLGIYDHLGFGVGTLVDDILAIPHQPAIGQQLLEMASA